MTIATLLAQTSRADALPLLAHVLRKDRAWIVAHPEAIPAAHERQAFEALYARRRFGEPVAYLLGRAGFYGREFQVSPNVLVPRPETELIIDEAIAYIARPMLVLDVGTGCGAIACTIAAQTQSNVDATDISPAAIEIARSNAVAHGVEEQCRFYAGDLAEPVSSNRYDLIVANLPYIPTAHLPQAPDPVSFEPGLALDGGPDGLALYRRLLPSLPKLINEDGLVLLEAAPPNIFKLKDLVCASLPNFTISVVPDYAKLPRYVRAERRALWG